MPLNEYECRACGRYAAVMVHDDNEPECPHCGARELKPVTPSFESIGGGCGCGCGNH